MRDMSKHPYSPDEQRVAAFFSERGIGGGDDPIGFLLSSYVLVIEERNALRRARADGGPLGFSTAATEALIKLMEGDPE